MGLKTTNINLLMQWNKWCR